MLNAEYAHGPQRRHPSKEFEPVRDGMPQVVALNDAFRENADELRRALEAIYSGDNTGNIQRLQQIEGHPGLDRSVRRLLDECREKALAIGKQYRGDWDHSGTVRFNGEGRKRT